MAIDRDLELRRQALILAGQLPPDLNEARITLDLMRQLVDGFLNARHAGEGNVVAASKTGGGVC